MDRSKEIRVAIIGVGNCASALVQSVEKSKSDSAGVRSLIQNKIGNYEITDITFTAAFDVDRRKINKDLSDAIFQEPNNTLIFKKVTNLNAKVYKGINIDGIGETSSKVVELSFQKEVNVGKILRETQTEILVNFLPVGSDRTARLYAEEAISSRCAFINCIPVFIASDSFWSKKFEAAKLPLIGDDVKSQMGATILHRTIVKLFSDRGITLKNTYQLNFGGNTDFLNMLDRDRLKSKKKSKTESVLSQTDDDISDSSVHISPSDYVPWLKDKKSAFIRLEGEGIGGAPVSIELKLDVWDSPNSAGVVVDAIRCAKYGLDNGIYGVLKEPSAYFMKRPPIQVDEMTARSELNKFLKRF